MRDNFRLKVLSLLLAVFLWYFVIGYENPSIDTPYNNIPIVLKNVDTIEEKGLTIGGDKESTVNVTVRGRTNSFINVKTADIKAEVDLSQYNENDTVFPIRFTVPEGLTIVNKTLTNAPISLEKIKSKEIKIEINLEGKPASDNQIIEVSAKQPETIVIEGADSLIQSVEKAVATVDSANVVDNTNRNLPLQLVNTAGEIVSGVSQSHQYVNVSFDVTMIKKVPVELVTKNDLPEGTTIVTSNLNETEISVSGPPDVIDNLDSIKTHALDLAGVVSDGEYDLTLDLPEGIRLTNNEVKLNVRFILDSIVNKEFKIEMKNIDLRKKPQNSSARILNEQTEFTVELVGLKSKVNPINADAIKAFIDLTGVSAGEGQIELEFEPIPDVTFENVNPKLIRVLITPSDGL